MNYVLRYHASKSFHTKANDYNHVVKVLHTQSVWWWPPPVSFMARWWFVWIGWLFAGYSMCSAVACSFMQAEQIRGETFCSSLLMTSWWRDGEGLSLIKLMSFLHDIVLNNSSEYFYQCQTQSAKVWARVVKILVTSLTSSTTMSIY